MSTADPRPGWAPQHPPKPAVFDLDEPFDVDGLHALRSTLAAHASSLGVPEQQVEALIMVASELATNAIRHGGGAGRIRLWHDDDGTLNCQVSDDGPGIADPAVGSTLPDPQHDGGRGLWIARSLSTDLVIESGPHGRGATLTATIRRPG